MQKRIAFIVGHENWGKSQTLRALKDICASDGRRVTIQGTEFLVRGMSNDDRASSFVKFMDTTKRPAIIAALCPKFEALNDDSPSKAIDRTLRHLRLRDYHLFFWVIEYKWATEERVTAKQIQEMRRYGIVKVFEGRKIEADARAKLFRSFVAGEVLK